ncbi:MAG TPA: selenium metabolism-associated LysR family transcriptional regulator [Thermodesulfovibrionales bacterium]|jgi:DNA-binding transcriptional LysR family regulator|nr:selenium metabolism-associated LysR family transcriptional regulator [Thermodesulfovibrionales bacterium]HZV46407.1 selenium metabolism-associated LysR family transcriptional regulator [Thermodesulfovibrionales bacterium]
MDIHKLRVFTSVFKNRSFSKASEALHLTQPTISNHIKALEDEFACKLFDRMGRTIIPTKEAEVLYGKATEIIEKADALKEALGQLKKETTGELVIGASTIPGVYLMPRIMKEFQKKFPAISFQILIADSGGVIDSISKHELLLGIVGAKLGNDQIDYTPFVEDELIVVSAPLKTEKSSMTLKELVALPMVFREEGSGTRREVEKFLESEGISFDHMKIAGIFGSTDAVKQAVKAGLGVSILSKFSVADELEHKLLEEIKLTDIHMKRNFYIVTHKKRTLTRLYDLFLKHILAETEHL